MSAFLCKHLFVCTFVHFCIIYMFLYYNYTNLPDPSQDLGLSLSPLEPSVPPGHNVSLSCTVERAGSFSWRFENGPLPPNAASLQRSPTASVLQISGVVQENAGAYTCQVNSVSRGVMNEDTAYVKVDGKCTHTI